MKIFKHTHTVVIETLCTRVEIPVEAWPVDDNVVLFYTNANIQKDSMADYYTLDGVLYRADDVEGRDYPVDLPWQICRRGFEADCMPVKPNMAQAAA